ncbi:hypothetical protein [Frankia sp. AgW1.1]|nr:hypothetical protein [Frankia sp. AgW1.1]
MAAAIRQVIEFSTGRIDAGAGREIRDARAARGGRGIRRGARHLNVDRGD